jgi:hypothetical protein
MAANKSLTTTIPTVAAGVALVDAPKAAAIGSMSVSWWTEEVKEGRAPKPAIRQPRCTRWRLQDVLDFWKRFAEQGSDPEATATLIDSNAKARKARAVRKLAKGGVTA